jgi:hypothetical protein
MPRRPTFMIATALIALSLNSWVTLVVVSTEFRPGTNPDDRLAQYCAPPQTESDAPKFYCRN